MVGTSVTSAPNANPPVLLDSVRVRSLPVAVTSHTHTCPSVGLLGTPRVRFPLMVTRKWVPSDASVAIVVASERTTGGYGLTAPRSVSVTLVPFTTRGLFHQERFSAWFPDHSMWSIRVSESLPSPNR